MSEYITAWLDDIDMAHVREEIVRCKDCKHYIAHAWVIYTDLEHICTFWNGGTGVKVEPDGFCKWGERMVVKE